ncbi:hypothetical protein GP486_005189 [Trichoglossum hirsutum]|uniref:Annexin n=1 Tax=Trichoglossum hirsutum TaxID=265104 RepID=A0A9P8L9R2_9PEZI|nr:hypothetical protein GP486_005189 [Trichoglossum hirsutum]
MVHRHHVSSPGSVTKLWKWGSSAEPGFPAEPQQPGYGAPPPPGQYPPPTYGQPPYGAPQYPPPQGYPPQGYPPPQTTYPPQPQYGQQPQGYPPPQGYPQGQYPPPQGYPQNPGYPPQPQQPYGQAYAPQLPPASQGYYGTPTAGDYGGAPGGYGGQPAYPSPGYVTGLDPQGDASSEVEALNKALKGLGTDGATLIRILSKADPIRIQLIRNTFHQRFGKFLGETIAKETGGHFREGLLAIVRGPLEQDAYNLYNAIAGPGTKEVVLNDVLLGRSNADLNAIKLEYHKKYNRSLEGDVKGDLSGKTERMFDMVLAARRVEESVPVNPQQVEADISELHRATEGKFGTDEVSVCAILTSRSDAQLHAIAQAYEVKYRVSLDRIIDKEFSGHMKAALHQIVRGATDRVSRDAQLLEDTMRGLGTKDDLLINRVVRFHWNRAYMTQVAGGYQRLFKRGLVQRIRGETRGDYEKLMVACVE